MRPMMTKPSIHAPGYVYKSLMKLYAGPVGGATRTMTVMSQCRNSAVAGASKGLLDAQKPLHGNKPSFASSWFRRTCSKLTASTLPKLIETTNAGRLRAPALLPKTSRKKRLATMTLLFAKSDFGIAAKYATLART
jgi:hypothetical protein